jgi:hypothetical protein
VYVFFVLFGYARVNIVDIPLTCFTITHQVIERGFRLRLNPKAYTNSSCEAPV